MSSNTPPILIVGTGAMASLFAARLSASGVPVMLLGTWAAGLEALQQNSVTLVDANGRHQTHPVQVTNDPTACAGTRFALVLVKSWQTERAASREFNSGERNPQNLRNLMADVINSEPLARLQYVSCAHPDTLQELDEPVETALLSMAVIVGKTRLMTT